MGCVCSRHASPKKLIKLKKLMSEQEAAVVQAAAVQLKGDSSHEMIEDALCKLAEVSDKDPQPIIAHESVLQLVASTISKSGITEEARLHASQVILQVLLRGHNGFQAVQPFRVLTPLIAAASSTHNPTAVRACLAATLIITSEHASESVLDEALSARSTFITVLVEWLSSVLETGGANHDEVDVAVRLLVFFAMQQEHTLLVDNGGFAVLRPLLLSPEEPRVIAALSIMMQCTDEACRDMFRSVGAVQLLPSLLTNAPPVLVHTPAVVRMTAVVMGNIADELTAQELLPALPRLVKMADGGDSQMQMAALFALSKLSVVDAVNMALAREDALQTLQDLYALSGSYDVRQLAGVIVYNIYYTLQQIPSAIVQARLQQLNPTNTTRCMQRVYEVVALFRLVFRAHSAHGRMPRALCHTVIADLCAKPPTEQQFQQLYSRVGTRDDALDFDRFLYLLYLCSSARLLVQGANLEGDVPLPRTGATVRVRLPIPHDLITEAFGNLPALFALFDADGDGRFDGSDFVRGLLVLMGFEPPAAVVQKLFDASHRTCRMEDFFTVLRIFFDYLESSTGRGAPDGSAQGQTPVAPMPSVAKEATSAEDDDTTEPSDPLSATAPHPLASPPEGAGKRKGSGPQGSQPLQLALSVAGSLAFGAGLTDGLAPGSAPQSPKTPPARTSPQLNAGPKGFLFMTDGTSAEWKRKWFVLEGNLLNFYADQGLVKDSNAGRVKLTDAVVTFAPEKGKRNCFKALFPDFSNGMRVLYLHAEVSDDMQQWMRALQKASMLK